MRRFWFYVALLLALLLPFAMYVVRTADGEISGLETAARVREVGIPRQHLNAPEPVYIPCEISYISENKPVPAQGEPQDGESLPGMECDMDEKTSREGAPCRQQPHYTDDDVFCLACVIYQEAGADFICDTCRYRVADVVLNRVADERFPETIRGVLEAYMQYGMFWDTGVCFPERANDASEQEAVWRAWSVAYDVLGGIHSELYGEGYVWQSEYVQSDDSFCCCGINYGR